MTVTAGKFDEYLMEDSTWNIVDDEHDVDWGQVSRWSLAMAMRAAAGIHGHCSSEEEVAWLDIAEQSISVAYEFQHAREQQVGDG